MGEALEGLLGSPILVTFLISMVPVVELRGAIPFGVSMGLPHWQAMAVAVVGNLVPVPFIILFIRRIFQWMRDKRSPALYSLSCLISLVNSPVSDGMSSAGSPSYCVSTISGTGTTAGITGIMT